jgi:mannose-6-phosphate isomerase
MSASLYPFTFHPLFKERVWGGRRLETLFGKALPPGPPIGEAWEISDRPGDASVIANGALAGRDLHWLMQHHERALLGAAHAQTGRFPLLIKILDAQDTLSLQVHPPAAKAVELGGEPKTEMWYLADATPDACLHVGLRQGATRSEFERRIADGTVAECFHRLPVRTGDAMFLPSGRVHAIGAGCVIFEIQQNSDTTYRVFDWNRLGLDGKPRATHVRESLASIDFSDFEPALLPDQPHPEAAARVRPLVRDPLFRVDHLTLPAGQNLTLTGNRTVILGLLAGRLLVPSAAHPVELRPGGFCLVPAAALPVAIHASTEATFLRAIPG